MGNIYLNYVTGHKVLLFGQARENYFSQSAEARSSCWAKISSSRTGAGLMHETGGQENFSSRFKGWRNVWTVETIRNARRTKGKSPRIGTRIYMLKANKCGAVTAFLGLKGSFWWRFGGIGRSTAQSSCSTYNLNGCWQKAWSHWIAEGGKTATPKRTLIQK